MNRLYQTLLSLLERGQDAVLAVIIEEEGSSPRGTGAQMLVDPDGLAAGSIGGGAAEGAALALAADLLRERRSERRSFRLRWDPKAKENPVCGGEIGVLLQYIPHGGPWHAITEALAERQERKVPCWLVLRLDGGLPGLLDEKGGLLSGALPESSACLTASRPVLTEGLFSLPVLPGERAVIFGGGHCSHALAPLLETVGFRVTVFDDRPEFANRERFPTAERVIVGDYLRIRDALTLNGEDYAIVMTTGHQHDYAVLEQILRGPLAYTGVIGSRTKTAYVNRRLREAGIPEEVIQSVHSPIGTAIHAVTPEEIAVSIAGELILCRALRRGETGKHACPVS